MVTNMIEKVREIVKNECEEWDWKYHIMPVVKYSNRLARELSVDEEIVELGALLHDIGRIRYGGENHEKTGVLEAEKILRELNYPQKTIDEIKHIVESHRGSKDISPKTLSAKIVANADAMAHFDVIPLLVRGGLKLNNNNLEKAFSWVYKKLERDWNKKLTIPEAKEITKKKYEAFKLLFDSMKEYI